MGQSVFRGYTVSPNSMCNSKIADLVDITSIPGPLRIVTDAFASSLRFGRLDLGFHREVEMKGGPIA